MLIASRLNACLLLAWVAPVLADPLGLYVGAGAGQSTLQQKYCQINSHVTGWQIFAGWRPLDWLGSEVEYANFGSKDVIYVLPHALSHISTSAHATGVFALGYLALPEPWLDIYGKAGAGRLQSNASVSYTATCPCLVPAPYVNDSSSTRFAFGAGAQFKFGLPAIRLEYERYTASQGDQALISLAVTVNF